jgi:hypothetical protein
MFAPRDPAYEKDRDEQQGNFSSHSFSKPHEPPHRVLSETAREYDALNCLAVAMGDRPDHLRPKRFGDEPGGRYSCGLERTLNSGCVILQAPPQGSRIRALNKPSAPRQRMA